jgi:GH35 family endo-1,4-beta-xylanase
MRRFTSLALLVLVVAGSFAACNRETTAADNKGLGAKVQDSVDSAKEKLASAQQEFRTTSDKKMKELDSSIASLRKRASEATDDSKAEWNELADSLETKREAIAAKLGDWKSIGADKWQSFTSEMDRMMNDLQRATSDALGKAK